MADIRDDETCCDVCDHWPCICRPGDAGDGPYIHWQDYLDLKEKYEKLLLAAEAAGVKE